MKLSDYQNLKPGDRVVVTRMPAFDYIVESLSDGMVTVEGEGVAMRPSGMNFVRSYKSVPYQRLSLASEASALLETCITRQERKIQKSLQYLQAVRKWR